MLYDIRLESQVGVVTIPMNRVTVRVACTELSKYFGGPIVRLESLLSSFFLTIFHLSWVDAQNKGLDALGFCSITARVYILPHQFSFKFSFKRFRHGLSSSWIQFLKVCHYIVFRLTVTLHSVLITDSYYIRIIAEVCY